MDWHKPVEEQRLVQLILRQLEDETFVHGAALLAVLEQLVRDLLGQQDAHRKGVWIVFILKAVMYPTLVSPTSATARVLFQSLPWFFFAFSSDSSSADTTAATLQSLSSILMSLLFSSSVEQMNRLNGRSNANPKQFDEPMKLASL